MTAPHRITSDVTYKEIERFWGYRFGDDGSIWSRRKSGYGHLTLANEWHLIRPMVRQRDGYLQISISVDGKKRRYAIHRLILEAFLGPCPEGLQACHNDGDRANNRLDNLRWDTNVANIRDKQLHGTTPRGSVHCCAKLTESDIGVIRKLRRDGWLLREIAERYGVALPSIHAIVQGRTWTHV